LAQLATAAVAVDGAARVLFANDAAVSLLAAADGIAEIGGCLHACMPAVTERLHSLIAAAAAVSVGRGVDCGGPLALPRRRGPALVGMVTPLRNEWLDFANGRPAALVLLRAPGGATALDSGSLQTVYDLTPTEARTACELARGKGAHEIAAAMGISIHTVRTHIRNAMRKVGAGRQAALVAIVLGSGGVV
jgi:DNA-binding CsgD family transcriptional regulator